MRISRVLALCLLPSLAVVTAVHAQPVAQVELLHAFRAAPGNPVGGLARAADGSFYGLTARLLYRVTSAGALTVAHTFDASATGAGAPAIAPDGVVYGTVVQADRVAVFRFDPATSAFRILHTFDTARDGHAGLNVGSLVIGPDGRLYGTTGGWFPGATPMRYGSVYRVDPVTGAGETLHLFSGDGPALRNPAAGLVVAGGQLYGTARFGGTPGPGPAQLGQGGIYHVDPATGAVSTAHLFTGQNGRNPLVGLTRTSDGWLYGTAFQHVVNGSSSASHVFRFNPQDPNGVIEVVLIPTGATNLLVAPSQLVEGADGHLYGSEEQERRVVRLRRQPGGGHALETVYGYVASDVYEPVPDPFAIGLDGFLYGSSMTAGPHRGGTVFRFDPLGAGGGGNPSQFTVVHPFLQNGHDWNPSVPARTANGDLYGTTSGGGSTLRGAVYRIDGTTGALTILGPMPGTLNPQGVIANSPLVTGSDGLLYGTTTIGGVRVNPGNGNIAAVDAWGDASGRGYTVGPAGRLYAVQEAGTNVVAAWFDIDANVMRGIATLQPVAGRGFLRTSRLGLGADGQLYAGILQVEPVGGPFAHVATLMRLDLASSTFVPVANLGDVGDGSTPAPVIGAPIGAANGTVLVPLRNDDGAMSVLEVTLATGAVRTACSPFSLAATLGADGALYGVDRRLRRCEPVTGATVEQPLRDGVGEAQDAPRLLAGVVHGAAVGGLYGGGTVFRLNRGDLPVVDTDGDGLSNAWESTYGLDPFRTDDIHGAGADPDGDGRTNAQELADGTHPNGVLTRYFAEGATNAFFHTRIDLGNPGVADAAVLLRFQTDTGAVVPHPVVVAPTSHVSVDPATITGLANVSFSTVLESDVPVIADRTMSWDATGYGSHRETAVLAPSTTWFFAEGTTTADSSLFYLLQNPKPTAVSATVRYLRALSLPPIEKTYVLPPHSRTTIPVDTEDPGLVSTDVSAQITATAPIIAERAMYRNQPGQPFAAGSGSAGVTAPALEWFLAEGATGTFFDLFILIANPNPTPAAVQVQYLPANGDVLSPVLYTVPANGRFTIWVDDQQMPAGSGIRPLANGAVSAVVRGVNGLPIVVERTMWWPGPETTPAFWYESHNSPGATSTALRWGIAGGDVGGPDGAETFVLIANATTSAGQVAVRVLTNDGSTASRTYAILPQSRTNVAIAADFPAAAAAGVASVLVESIDAIPVPIAVESASYASPGGVLWARGTNALATPLP